MKRLTQNVCALWAALGLAAGAYAQYSTMGAFTPAGVSAAPSYGSSSFEQYNPFNGYLSAALPLHHIGGRGEAGFDLIWNLQPGWLAANIGKPGLSSVAIDPFPSNNIAGASSNAYGLGGPGWVYIRTGANWQTCGSTVSVSQTVTTIVFAMPNGSHLALADTNTSGAPEPTTPFACDNPYTGSSSWDEGRGTSFRSTDNSQIQFNADSNVLEQNVNTYGYGVATVSGYLIFPNGVTYRVDNSNVTWVRDRNGNKVSLLYGGPSTQIDWYLNVPAMTQITDSLDRVTNINYNDTTAYANCNGCLTITYPGTAGTPRQIQIITGALAGSLRSDSTNGNYTLMSIGALFPNSGQGTSSNYNPTVASMINLPDASQYAFKYNSYGELARVTLPSGGSIEYDYGDGLPNAHDNTNGSNNGYETASNGTNAVMIYRRLLTRREYANGGTGATYSSKTTHTVAYPPGQTTDTVQVSDSTNGVISQTVHTMSGAPTDALTLTATSCNDAMEGVEVQTDTGTTATAVITVKNGYPATSGCTNNPLPDTRTTILVDASKQSEIGYTYDRYGNVSDEKDYDWTSIGSTHGNLLREIATTYEAESNLSYAGTPFSTGPSYNLIRIPAIKTVSDSSGTLAVTDWQYDMGQPTPATMSGRDSGFDSSNITQRGNVTNLYQLKDANGGFLQTTYTYDIAGNVLSIQDVTRNTTHISYADKYSDGTNRNTYALPTSITNPLNQVSYYQYDYNTGKPTMMTDLNGIQTVYSYGTDPLDRLIQVETAKGTTADNVTNYSYSAAGYPPLSQTVTQAQTSSNDQALKSTQYWDGLGRPYETDLYTDNSHYIATTTTYDALSRVYQVSNPFNAGSDTPIYKTYRYDSLSRPLSVTTPDGAASTNTYYGNLTTVADARSHARALTLDALGRITNVTEDPGTSGLNFGTSYSYDGLGNLKQVNQGSQTRTFSYDPLSRLLSATNPESGSVSYVYDGSGSNGLGNLWTRTDNKNSVTTYTYDPLSRPLTVAYSDGTPGVTFTYDDPNASNSKGHLTSIANGVSTTQYTQFDPLGNVLKSSQTTTVAGTPHTYSFQYGYNLLSALTSETYPSGRTVTTAYDGANRPITVTGANAGSTTNYVAEMHYWPHGAPYYFNYSNGLTRAAAYNAQLQPIETYEALNNTNDAQHMLFATCPDWGAPNQTSAVYTLCPSTSGSQDNGTLQGLTFIHGASSFKQTYQYDNLNRLTMAGETGSSGNTVWSQTYNYDQYGNLWMANLNLPAYMPMPSSNVYNGKNQNPSTGITYDNAGNQTALGSVTLSYDAQNRQVGSAGIVGGSASYQYDGAGQRVLKTVGSQPMSSQTILYVFDAFGQLAAEYDSQAVTAPPCLTCYLSYDHLGTVRLVTDGVTGAVIARHDFAPFGQEIPSGVNARTNVWGLSTDVDMKFTGQLRDTENELTTGEDFFNARYYHAGSARFLSPDPFNAGADITNPQSWNAYAYVTNNPLGNVDPTGTCDVLVNGVSQSPGWAPIDNFGANMMNVFPFAGTNFATGSLSVLFGNSGSDATYSALEAALAQTPAGQSVNVFAISGGAQSFTLAYNMLSSQEQSRIGNVTYMIAGSNAAVLPSGTGTTNWIMDWSDPLIPAGRPKGSFNPYFAYNSFHNPAKVIADFETLLNSMRGSSCPNPGVVVPQSSNKGTATSTIHYGGVVGGGGVSSPGSGYIFTPTYGEEGNFTGGFWYPFGGGVTPPMRPL